MSLDLKVSSHWSDPWQQVLLPIKIHHSSPNSFKVTEGCIIGIKSPTCSDDYSLDLGIAIVSGLYDTCTTEECVTLVSVRSVCLIQLRGRYRCFRHWYTLTWNMIKVICAMCSIDASWEGGGGEGVQWHGGKRLQTIFFNTLYLYVQDPRNVFNFPKSYVSRTQDIS